MDINKEAGVDSASGLDEAELAQINAMSKKQLKAEEVYTFAVRLCDNEIDRDGERFTPETLAQLAELFVGKSGIFDHQWSAKGQAARIYRTQLVEEAERSTQAGDPYCYLKGYAYMLRTPGNEELIAQIEGGIKREVSVGCAVAGSRCSICGEEYHQGGCTHEKGKRYGNKLCWVDLVEATDAYEWSFVAVPAQKNAGVMKQMRQDNVQLEKEAALGRKYLELLREETVRLGGLAGLGLEHQVLTQIAKQLEEPELAALKGAFQRQADRALGLETQLSYAGRGDDGQELDGAFLI